VFTISLKKSKTKFLVPCPKCLICSVKISSKPAVFLFLKFLIVRFSSYSENILVGTDDCNLFFLLILRLFLLWGFSIRY